MSEDDREAPEQSGASRHVRPPRPHGRRARRARRTDPATEPGAPSPGRADGSDPSAAHGSTQGGVDEQHHALEEARRALRVRRGGVAAPVSSSAAERNGAEAAAPADRSRSHRASAPAAESDAGAAPQVQAPAPAQGPARVQEPFHPEIVAAPGSESDPARRSSPSPHPDDPGDEVLEVERDHADQDAGIGAAGQPDDGEPQQYSEPEHFGGTDDVSESDDYREPYSDQTVDDEPDDDDDHPFAGFAHEQKRRSPLHILPVLLVLVVVLAVGAGAVYGYSWLRGNVNVDQAQQEDYDGSGSDEEVVIEVAEGDSGSDIAKTLVDKGVIKSAPPFVRLFGTSQEASRIQPGSYRLNTKMSSASALEALLDPSSQTGLRVTIPEGMRMKDIFERISKTTGIPVKDFEKAAKNYTDYGIPKNKADSPEGYLWPGRYDIAEDATAGDVLEMMWKRMESELDDLGVAPKDRVRVLTLASIAEKEARDPEDYGRVVRTLENRLEGAGDAHGKPMKLQLDSTVAYFSGSDSISTTPKQRETDSPYNTYMHEGLPVGPISNPGKATLEAAADPPQGKWLYWVTVDTSTGETKFADTYAEHEKNVAEWKKRAATKDGDG